MTLIKQYVQAMLNQDSVALSKLFPPPPRFLWTTAPRTPASRSSTLTAPRGLTCFSGTASCSGGLKSPIP